MYFHTVTTEIGPNEPKHNPCNLLSFKSVHLRPGDTYTGESHREELLFVILRGRVSIAIGDTVFREIGGRTSVFDGSPHSVFVPPHSTFHIDSQDYASLAICGAPSETDESPFHIPPEAVETGTWGKQNFTRYFRKILVDTDRKVDRLIVGETITPSGNWSSFPPHKHEEDKLPDEVFAEELYYFKVSPGQGWGLTYHYSDDGTIDQAHVVRDETILFIPKGYHTVVSAPGHTTYYLWVLAGNHRWQAVSPDPAIGWVKHAESMLG